MTRASRALPALVAAALLACVAPPEPLAPVWTATGSDGASSSPRAVDLDGDGVLDIVTGHGREAPGGRGTLTAHDGATGELMWEVRQEIGSLIGSPLPFDANGDATPDLAVGGRDGACLVVDGASGSTLWQLRPDRAVEKAGSYNFYTPQLVADHDGDGVSELLFANGGDASIPAFMPRENGFLMVLSGATGRVLATAPTPDGRETYMSPYTYRRAGEETVIFGTGGETFPGALWVAPLELVYTGDLTAARAVSEPASYKGVIAPPALGDLTGDGTLDIVASLFDGQVVAVDGASLETLWRYHAEGHETSSSPVLGYFNGDDVPDAFAMANLGDFPYWRGSRLVILDGATGRPLWERDDPGLANSSPVVVDLDRDGTDELLTIRSASITGLRAESPRSLLRLLDPDDGDERELAALDGMFLATPWLGDLDGDAVLDLVTVANSRYGTENFGHGAVWTLVRWRLHEPRRAWRRPAEPPPVRWGAYLGSRYDGRMTPRR